MAVVCASQILLSLWLAGWWRRGQGRFPSCFARFTAFRTFHKQWNTCFCSRNHLAAYFTTIGTHPHLSKMWLSTYIIKVPNTGQWWSGLGTLVLTAMIDRD
jgi:hypothetical protein